MGMGLSYYLMRLARMLEPQPRRAGRSGLSDAAEPAVHYGGCPACGEFLCVAAAPGPGDVRCPSCGRVFDRATPLAPFVSEKRPPAGVYDRELDGSLAPSPRPAAEGENDGA